MLKRTAKEFVRHRCMLLSAGLSFYTALSFAPALILVIWGTSTLGATTQQQILAEISAVAGSNVGEVARLILENAAKRPAVRSVAGLAAFVGMLLSATTVFAQLKQAMNVVWDVHPRPGTGALRALVHKHVTSFLMLLFSGVLLLLAGLISALVNLLMDDAPRSVSRDVLRQVVQGGTSLSVSILAIAAIFKFLPDVIIDWRSVWLPATLTAVLLLVGKYLIAAYFSWTALGSVYGAGGTLFVLPLWVQYSWITVFCGAEFAQVWARERGQRIEPRFRAGTVEPSVVVHD